MLIKKLRAAGFSVRLKAGDAIGVKPIERLTPAQSDWIRLNREVLLDELKREAAANDETHEVHKCSDCQHDRRSPYNPTGGLTGCKVRDDVTPMLPGTRSIPCALFEAANDD